MGTSDEQGVLSKAIEAYRGVCLATAPDFSGVNAAATRAGMQKTDGYYILPNSAARVEVFPHEGGCTCLTALIAPDPNASAAAVFEATVSANPQQLLKHPDPEISSILVWPSGTNALQVQGDVRGPVPMLNVYLISKTACPQS